VVTREKNGILLAKLAHTSWVVGVIVVQDLDSYDQTILPGNAKMATVDISIASATNYLPSRHGHFNKRRVNLPSTVRQLSCRRNGGWKNSDGMNTAMIELSPILTEF
jgi:hypothetical protein